MKKNRLPYGKAGFKVPDNYFENFEARIMRQVAPMDHHVKKNPFKVPEHYFEELEGNIFDRLEETTKKAKVIPLFNRRTWSYIAGVAAVLVVFFSSVVLKETQKLTFEDLDIVAVENYLLESMDDDDPKYLPENYNFTASTNPFIDKEALLDYLHENVEEPALLLNED